MHQLGTVDSRSDGRGFIWPQAGSFSWPPSTGPTADRRQAPSSRSWHPRPGVPFNAVQWPPVPSRSFSRLEISTRVAPTVASNVCWKRALGQGNPLQERVLLGGPSRIRPCDRRIMSPLHGAVAESNPVRMRPRRDLNPSPRWSCAPRRTSGRARVCSASLQFRRCGRTSQPESAGSMPAARRCEIALCRNSCGVVSIPAALRAGYHTSSYQ
jgi:hypothetical protein